MWQQGLILLTLSLLPSLGDCNVAAGLRYLEQASTTGLTTEEKTEYLMRASGYFKKVLKEDSVNYEAVFGMAKLLTKFPSIDFNRDALAYAQKAVDLDANHDSFTVLASAYIALNNMDYARKCIKEMLDFEPKSARAYRSLGFIYYREGEYEKAIEQYRIGLTFRPDSHKLLNNLAAAHMRQGVLDNALHYGREALQANPYYPNAHFILGLTLKKMGRPEEARKAFEKAVELRPTALNYRRELREMG